MAELLNMDYLPERTRKIYQHLGNSSFISNFTREVNPNLSPVTYKETLVYTKDIAEDNISSHLSPAEKVNKDQMAAFFSQELIKIQELI